VITTPVNKHVVSILNHCVPDRLTHKTTCKCQSSTNLVLRAESQWCYVIDVFHFLLMSRCADCLYRQVTVYCRCKVSECIISNKIQNTVSTCPCINDWYLLGLSKKRLDFFHLVATCPYGDGFVQDPGWQNMVKSSYTLKTHTNTCTWE